MLEIPESHVIADQVARTLQGKTIHDLCTASSPHRFAFYFGDPQVYHDRLVGKTITGAWGLGGLIEIAAEEMQIVVGDGAYIRYFEAGSAIPNKHQLHLTFDDASSLVCTVQMYGAIWAFAKGENENPYYLVAQAKPTPLTDQFDAPYFQRLLDGVKPNIRIKPLLATEQRIPGLGNGVLQDILFNAKVNPKSTLERLSDQEINGLFHSVRQTLREMTTQGGRDLERNLFGCPGGYSTLLSSKTWRYPCPACGSSIVKQTFMGGSVYYCPTCQPEKV